jgi:hypothetical protein
MNRFDPNPCSPPEWSFETVGSGTASNGTTGNEEGVVAAVLSLGRGTYSAESGNVRFAGTSVSEPSSIGLMFARLASAVGLAKRRFCCRLGGLGRVVRLQSNS